MKSEMPTPKHRRELLLPKWMVPFVWAVIVLIIQVFLPWVIARIGPRFGWSGQSPAGWNRIGLIAVAMGLGLYSWCLAFHYRSYRAAVRVGFTPPHLVVGGPYQISRNPMYLSGLFAWLGWTVYYGSPAVLVALVLLWFAFAVRVIPHEERLLADQFGDAYQEYKGTVRRWIGRY